jgi:hypothetical protein
MNGINLGSCSIADIGTSVIVTLGSATSVTYLIS